MIPDICVLKKMFVSNAIFFFFYIEKNVFIYSG